MRKAFLQLSFVCCVASTATAASQLVMVRTPKQLSQLNTQTYVAAIICGLVFLALAAIASSLVKFQGGANPSDPRVRRVWFWVLLIVCFGVFFLYNRLMVSPKIAASLQSRFMMTTVMASFAAAFTYLAAGFLVSKISATGKLGNWFPSKH